MTQNTHLDLHPDLTRHDVCHHLRRLIKACGGLLKAGAVISLSKSQMSNFQNPNMPDWPRLDQVLALEAFVGEPIVTAAMAQAQGLAALDCPSRPDLTLQSIGVTALSAELSAATAAALSDGKLSVNEADQLRELRTRLDDLLAQFDARKVTQLRSNS